MRYQRVHKKEEDLIMASYQVNLNYETHQETEQAFQLNKEGGVSLIMETKEFSKKRQYGIKENTITRRITKTEYEEFKRDEEKRKNQLLQKLNGLQSSPLL